MLTEEAIVEQIQADQEMMTVLAIIRDLNLADAWLAAGAVRNFIWNWLSGRPGFDARTDMDLVFYDPAISYEETQQIEQTLKKTYPQYAWEVKNQLELFLPYGTRDIEDFIVQPTPHFLANPERLAVYTERMKKKNWKRKWPALQIILPE